MSATANKNLKKSNPEEIETPWDFYVYVAISLLNWDINFFLKATPKLWLKSYVQWLETKNPDLFENSQTLTIDKSPFW